MSKWKDEWIMEIILSDMEVAVADKDLVFFALVINKLLCGLNHHRHRLLCRRQHIKIQT